MLKIGKNDSMKEYVLFTDNMTSVIDECEFVKDLGVLVDNEASLRPQLLKSIKKAQARSTWVLRTFVSRGELEMKTLWKSLIRPHLDYCSQLWSPATISSNINMMEATQREFKKRIQGMHNLEYKDRLKKLKLLFTERRTQRYKIIYCWKVLQGIVPNCGLINVDKRGKGRTLKVPKVYAKVRKVREESLLVEGPMLFNSLPAMIRNYDGSKEGFKNLLDNFCLIFRMNLYIIVRLMNVEEQMDLRATQSEIGLK